MDARCQLKVDISGKSTSVTWYEIWEATVALSTMCVRAQDKGGKAFGLGECALLKRFSDEERLIRGARSPEEYLHPTL